VQTNPVLALLYFKSALHTGQASISNSSFGIGSFMLVGYNNYLLNISKNRKIYKSIPLPLFKLIVVIFQEISLKNWGLVENYTG
jgi:hypothetical protein